MKPQKGTSIGLIICGSLALTASLPGLGHHPRDERIMEIALGRSAGLVGGPSEKIVLRSDNTALYNARILT